jgi:hypothetical protein
MEPPKDTYTISRTDRTSVSSDCCYLPSSSIDKSNTEIGAISDENIAIGIQGDANRITKRRICAETIRK